MSTNEASGQDSIESRTKRALTEAMTVLPNHGRARGAENLFTVVGQHGNGEYLVNLNDGSCTCKDSQYNLDNETDCKHVRRVRVCIGDMPIPNDALGEIQIDNTFGAHVDSTPVYATADGGIITSQENTDPEADKWSVRPEIDKYGVPTGSQVAKCTSCGIETITSLIEYASHKDTCQYE